MQELKAVEQEQRRWLGRFGKEVAGELNALELPVLRTKVRFPVQKADYTQGWFVEIGDIRIPGTNGISVYLDDIVEQGTKRLQIGFFARDKARITQMAKAISKHLGNYRRLTADDYEVVDNWTVMGRPLKARDFGRPILELFDGLKNYGVHYSDRINFTRPPSRAVVLRSVRFFARVLTALDGFYLKDSRTPEKPFNNREATVTTRIISRSSAQAAKAKRRDGYRCRLCLSRPEDVYGAEGRSCLDAHHVKALHADRRRNRQTVLAGLVTVCANCHRVLGQLPPNERGFRQLQTRFRRPSK